MYNSNNPTPLEQSFLAFLDKLMGKAPGIIPWLWQKRISCPNTSVFPNSFKFRRERKIFSKSNKFTNLIFSYRNMNKQNVTKKALNLSMELN